ncbi:MAG: GIY-YIG nuclease family protein [Chloroflexota bacterium]
MPTSLHPMGKSDYCSVHSDGMITLPDVVVRRIGWTPGVRQKIVVDFILDPVTLLFRKAEGGRAGFTLSYLNKNGDSISGGKISCSAFINQYVKPKLILPIRDLVPIYDVSPYNLALLLEQPDWCRVPFSKSGQTEIDGSAIGIYQLLGHHDHQLYVGIGNIAERFNAHLRRDDMVSVGRQFEYHIIQREDALLLEKILMALHESEFGDVPEFNQRR